MSFGSNWTNAGTHGTARRWLRWANVFVRSNACGCTARLTAILLAHRLLGLKPRGTGPPCPCTVCRVCAKATGPPPPSHHRQKLLPASILTFLSLAILINGPARGGEELVGLRVGKRLLETLLVERRQDRFWLPLEETSTYLSVEVLDAKTGAGKNAGVRLATPLGPIAVPPGSIHRSGTIKYIDQRFLERHLNAKVSFAADDGIIEVDLPWRAGATAKATEDKPTSKPLEPEAWPDKAGLSTFHGDLSYRHATSGSSRFEGYLKATGHAYGGVWQVNYEEDLLTRHRIRDAVWMKQIDDNRFVQIGHQTIALHPLLQSVEMSGVQFAWTNANVTQSRTMFTSGALLDRRVEHHRTFDGKGPVGGRAELWLDDRLYAQTPIGLSGSYRFSDIHLPARNNRVEIRIYDRRNATAPIDVLKKRLNLSDLLLQKGQYAVVAGGGIGGNAFDYATEQLHGRQHGDQPEETGRLASFAFARYAMSDRVTAEAGVGLSEGNPHLMAGAVARLSKEAVGTASAAYDEKGGLAYLAEVDWRKADWQLTARSLRRQRAIRTAAQSHNGSRSAAPYDPDWDHFLELAYLARSNLRVGLIARAQPEAQFVLPFARWQPSDVSVLEARPDQYGIYRIDGRYQLSKDAHVFATYYDGDGTVSYVRRMSGDRYLTAELQRSYEGAWRAGMRLSAASLLDYDLDWNVGGYISDDLDYTLQAYARREIRPGIHAYIDGSYSSSPRSFFRDDNLDDFAVRVGLTFDLALSRGELVAAPSNGVRIDQGALAGRVKVAGGGGGADLSGIAVRVDGTTVGRTNKDGTFYAPNIKTGTHVVDFDEDTLPIEQVAGKRQVVARIAPGAITSVGLTTKVLYGAAGRLITRRGPAGEKHLIGRAIAIFDRNDKEVARAETNSFGYFRVDGLAPGSYTAALLNDGDGVAARRSFKVTNDYVFDVDITVD